MTVREACALWIEARGRAALRAQALPPRRSEDVVVATLFTAISRGTEALILSGGVPESEYDRMRAPQQEGDFPFPVKYGYSLVGTVEDGPAERIGETVFSLHPHQNRAVIAGDMAHRVPDGVPPARAVLAANMETALNTVWDAGIAPGDRVAVVGGGVVGMLIAWLATGIRGTRTALVDINAERAATARELGVDFALPEDAPRGCDVVVHVSASEAGLETALELAGQEARVVEASWYGERAPQIKLGGAFHSRRLQIVSSQVGGLPATRLARWTFARRMGAALDLLTDPRLDALISGESAFMTLAEDYPRILGASETLCHRIRY